MSAILARFDRVTLTWIPREREDLISAGTPSYAVIVPGSDSNLQKSFLLTPTQVDTPTGEFNVRSAKLTLEEDVSESLTQVKAEQKMFVHFQELCDTRKRLHARKRKRLRSGRVALRGRAHAIEWHMASLRVERKPNAQAETSLSRDCVISSAQLTNVLTLA